MKTRIIKSEIEDFKHIICNLPRETREKIVECICAITFFLGLTMAVLLFFFVMQPSDNVQRVEYRGEQVYKLTERK